MGNWIVGDCDGYLWFVDGVFRELEGNCRNKTGLELNLGRL